MPVYNTAAFVETAVRSILDQTLTDLELIVIDDGSTDGSSAILKRLADNDARLRLARRPNTGYTVALHEALAQARAPLVARMDSDDVSLPTRLEKQACHLDAHPDIALLGTAWTVITPDGRRVPTDPHTLGIWSRGPDAIARRLAAGHNCLAHPSVMFRRAAFDAAGGYDPSYEPAEDFECWLRLSRTHKIACLPEPLLDYRVHPNNTGSTRAGEQVASVARAVHAHWAATAPPTADTRRTLHRHIALLYYSARDRRRALREGLRVPASAPHRPGLWVWYLRLIGRVIKGPSY